MNPEHNSIQHLSVILNKLETKEPFAIIRPADGEYSVMIGNHLTNCDNWTFKGGELQSDLLSIKNLKNGLNNFFIGIPCRGCWGDNMYNWFINTLNITDSERTYANIFCNKNWKTFTNYLIDNKIPLNYVGPGSNTSSLNIKNKFTISPYLVNNWDNEKENFVNDIINWVKNIIDLEGKSVFVFSAGPISKYIIPILYKQFPESQFLDVGSSLDIFMKGTSNRDYIYDNQEYANIVCNLNTGHNVYSEKDIEQFEGGWSYTQKEIRDFLKNINYRDSYKILEFGAGNSTKKIYDIISKFCYKIEYDTYETDINYKIIYKNVNTIMYNIDNIDNIILPNKLYDIILIDGPNGVLRSKWYKKIRNNIKYDTIILIDDYNHYIEFENELNNNFNYTILSKSDIPFAPNGEHSWRIITNITLK